MNRPTLEVADIIRAAGKSFIERNRNHLTWPQLKVLRAKGRNCRYCEGLGTIEMMNDKGEVEARTCQTCKGLKFERLVNFR